MCLDLDIRDRRGLEWIRDRSRAWLTEAKRRRKYQPPGDFTPEEMALFNALIEMEKAAKVLLGDVKASQMKVES